MSLFQDHELSDVGIDNVGNDCRLSFSSSVGVCLSKEEKFARGLFDKISSICKLGPTLQVATVTHRILLLLLVIYLHNLFLILSLSNIAAIYRIRFLFASNLFVQYFLAISCR